MFLSKIADPVRVLFPIGRAGKVMRPPHCRRSNGQGFENPSLLSSSRQCAPLQPSPMKGRRTCFLTALPLVEFLQRLDRSIPCSRASASRLPSRRSWSFRVVGLISAAIAIGAPQTVRQFRAQSAESFTSEYLPIRHLSDVPWDTRNTPK
jgi:hypothetical protein